MNILLPLFSVDPLTAVPVYFCTQIYGFVLFCLLAMFLIRLHTFKNYSRTVFSRSHHNFVISALAKTFNKSYQ